MSQKYLNFFIFEDISNFLNDTDFDSETLRYSKNIADDTDSVRKEKIEYRKKIENLLSEINGKSFISNSRRRRVRNTRKR